MVVAKKKKKKSTKAKAKSKAKPTKAKQQELPAMPKRDKVGRAAKKYLTARDKLAEAKVLLLTTGAKLVKELNAVKKTSIKVEGATITLRHIGAQDMLNVKKPRE